MEIHGCATMILVITAMSAMKIRNIGYLPKLFIIGTSKDTKVSTEFHISTIMSMKNFTLYIQRNAGFPFELENLKRWEDIFQSGNFEQTGKVREKHIQYWKTQEFQTNVICYFLVIFK